MAIEKFAARLYSSRVDQVANTAIFWWRGKNPDGSWGEKQRTTGGEFYHLTRGAKYEVTADTRGKFHTHISIRRVGDPLSPRAAVLPKEQGILA